MNDEFKNKNALTENQQRALQVGPPLPHPPGGGGIGVLIAASIFSISASILCLTLITQRLFDLETQRERNISS